MISFSALKTLELEAIKAIRTEGEFGRLNTLRNAAMGTQINTAAAKAPVNLHLSFTLPTKLREDPGRATVDRSFHVGCYAEMGRKDEISHLSYSVLIGQEAHPSKLVARKFHFDFEPAAFRNTAEPKPTFHLQMCGKLSEHHISDGYTEEDIKHLLPSWSQPRIPAQPMSLALILNWLFIEFGHDITVRNARINNRWRNIVKSAERVILKPYYMACAEFLDNNANNDDSFFSKKIYEE